MNKRAILAIILVSYVMIVLDTSVVLTGLPKIHLELGFSDTGLAWVQSAYTLTFGGFLLLAARAGDIVGRRRMLVGGLALFTLASLAIGAAATPMQLVAARAVQGLGAAILAPSTLALLQITFAEGGERTHAVSLYSATAGIAASVGLVLGGVLAEWLSWRVGFLINLPIGVAMIWAALRYIPESPRRSGQFDLTGALTSTVGMSALVYAFIRSASAGWSDLLTQAALAAGLLLLVAFVANERSAAQRGAAYHAAALVCGSPARFGLRGADAVPGGDDRLLFLYHAVSANGAALSAIADRHGFPADDAGEFCGGAAGAAPDAPLRQCAPADGRAGGVPGWHGVAESCVAGWRLLAGSGAADGVDRRRAGLDLEPSDCGRYRPRAGAGCRRSVRRGECGAPVGEFAGTGGAGGTGRCSAVGAARDDRADCVQRYAFVGTGVAADSAGRTNSAVSMPIRHTAMT
jgi:MFS family permease